MCTLLVDGVFETSGFALPLILSTQFGLHGHEKHEKPRDKTGSQMLPDTSIS